MIEGVPVPAPGSCELLPPGRLRSCGLRAPGRVRSCGLLRLLRSSGLPGTCPGARPTLPPLGGGFGAVTPGGVADGFVDLPGLLGLLGELLEPLPLLEPPPEL